MSTTVADIHSIPAGSVSERVLAVVSREANKDPKDLVPEATLDALNVDSVDVVMILNGIEEEFDVYLPVEQGFAEVKCLRDFVALVTRQIDEQLRAR